MQELTRSTLLRFGLFAVVAVALPGVAPGNADASEEAADPRSQAIEHYESARYEEALPLLVKLDADGRATGTDLYRLYYCQTVTEDPAARTTLRRSIETLESEARTTEDIDVPFYLANAYRNLARLTDMKRVAAEAIGKIESGAWPEPKSGVASFRLGKLYADEGSEALAGDWYARSIEAFEREGRADSPYAQWAVGYLGRRAFDAGDYETAVRRYDSLLSAEDAAVEDLNRLAVASIKLGNFEAAQRAWGRAIVVAPATSNRASYSARLAAAAHKIGGVAAKSPDGRDWPSLGRGDLETVLVEQATKVRQIIDAIGKPPEEITRDERIDINNQLLQIRKVFVAAGLEYVVKGFPIRETAFQAGYAPLIFRSTDWAAPTLSFEARAERRAKRTAEYLAQRKAEAKAKGESAKTDGK